VSVSGPASSSSPGYAARNAADMANLSYFNSKNEVNPWICYDFKDRRVRPTHYSIYPHSSNYYLRSWALEGSLDNLNWIELDRRDDNTEMDSNHPIGTFPVARSNIVEYQSIRLRQTGKNANMNYHLTLYAFELFGYLTEYQTSQPLSDGR
jgi:hypothetical protein